MARYTKKKFSRRRRYGRKRRTFRRTKKKLTQNTVYRFSRIYKPGELSSSTTNDVCYAESFQLSVLPGVSDFTTLFDQYKITGVKITWIPQVSDTTMTQTCGNLAYVYDVDDGNAPPSFTWMMEKQGVKVIRPNRMFSMFVKPKPASVFFTNPANSYGTVGGPWIDMNSTTCPHYGLKWVWSPTTTVTKVDVYYKYYLAVRGVQ